MMVFGLNFAGMLMLCCCCLKHVKGDDVCTRNLTQRINLSTQLEFKILLPCYFDPAFVESNKNENTSVVWTQINTTVHNIVEIKAVQGVPAFWDNRRGRIKAFSYISGSGNFSILIQNVQKSDLGLYHCKLYRDVCYLAYKELNISLADEFSLLNNWMLMLGGGGFLLLCLITACCVYTWTKRQTVEKSDEITYASFVHRSHSHNSNDIMGNEDISTPASDLLSSESVIYAAIKEGDRRQKNKQKILDLKN